MLQGFEPREYQKVIALTANANNTLVVLPTGLGKTNVFLMVAAKRLATYPESKILFVGPTRPLIEQYFQVFKEHLDMPEGKMAMLTGKIPPIKRQQLWELASVIFSTPQSIEHDLLNKKIDLSKVSLFGVDEAHRAVGKYSYSWIAEQYMQQAKHSRILALTASPGSEKSKINEVCKNLFIERIEVRTEDDVDVKPYMKEKKIIHVPVHLPSEFEGVLTALKKCMTKNIDAIRRYGLIRESPSKTELLRTQASLHGQLAHGNKTIKVLHSLSLLAQAIKVSHAIELAESQSIPSLCKYLDKLAEEGEQGKTKAAKSLLQNEDFKTAKLYAEGLLAKGVTHPKIKELRRIVVAQKNKKNNTKIIVFTQYRDTAVLLKEQLETIEILSPRIFVGQNRKGGLGMNQNKQKELLEQFKDNQFDVLIATSIGEEGLDIPQVDVVVFYEPVPSAIRQIQRIGRTSRRNDGTIFILVAKNTRDEVFRWVAQSKQRNMHRLLKELKTSLLLTTDKKKIPKKKAEEDITIVIDTREKQAMLARQLMNEGVKIQLATLATGDYLVSNKCCVEFKTVPDFVASILDGRLLQQTRSLRELYERPLIIIEGEEDIYSVRNVHPHAILGAFVTLLRYNVPFLQTKNMKETAGVLYQLAKAEQRDGPASITLHAKKPKDLKQQQEFVISSLPGIEGSLAPQLLKVFGNVRNVMNASEEEMMSVPLIGKKKASAITSLVGNTYSC